VDRALRVLHLEDNAADAALVRDVLEAGGIACNITRVQTREDFIASLDDDGGLDLILADHSLPAFDGMSALAIAAQESPDVPFVFVSGTLGEELAIEALKLGATDYVLKERLSRIVSAVRGALHVAHYRAERKRAERELRRSEAFLAEAQRMSHTGSWGWILSTGQVTWSEEQYRLFGFEPGQVEPSVDLFMSVVHEQDRPRVRRVQEESTGARRPYEMEYRVVLPDRSLRHLRTIGRPVPAEAGELEEYMGTTTDMTDRVRTEAILRQREKELRDVIETVPAIAWTTAPDGSNTFASRRWTEYTGLSAHDTQGWGWSAAVHPDDLDGLVNKWRQSVASGAPLDNEVRYRRAADGEYRWFLVRAVPLRDERGNILKWYGIAADIEDRKRAEQALRQSESKLEEAQRIAHIGYWERDLDTGEVVVSDETRRIFGIGPQQNVGELARSHTLWSVVLHTESWPRLAGSAAAALGGELCFDKDFRIIRPDGNVRIVRTRRHVTCDEAGRPRRMFGVLQDITELRQAEADRAALAERLRQAEKMEAIGRFASGIAHDFNNMLGGILGYGEMLFDDAPPGSERKRYAQNVLTAASRGRDLVNQILAYSRRSQGGKRTPTDICSTAAESFELLRSSIPPSVVLEVNIPESPLVVGGDATQLHQVIMNLCSNSIHAMKAGGIMRVAITTSSVGRERALSHSTLRPGEYVCLSFEDNGCGMEEATLARIFEPFFTTKEVGSGTGLGLALVYAIATDLKGAIDVKSAPAQGSTFSIYLPLAERSAPAAVAH